MKTPVLKRWLGAILLPLLLTESTHAFYNPDLGRWITRDPIGEMGGSNLQVFSENNPNGFVDPDGLDVVSTPYDSSQQLDLDDGTFQPNGSSGPPSTTGQGNRPVAFPVPPPSMYPRCPASEEGQIRNRRIMMQDCPCSGAVQTCRYFEICHPDPLVVRTQPTAPSRYVWIPRFGCTDCPEYAVE